MPTPPTLEIFCVWVWCGWSSERRTFDHLLLIKYKMVTQEQTVPANRKITIKVQTILDHVEVQHKQYYKNNIIDKMQSRKRLYELVEYEKYNSLDEKIYNFNTDGHE